MIVEDEFQRIVSAVVANMQENMLITVFSSTGVVTIDVQACTVSSSVWCYVYVTLLPLDLFEDQQE